MTAEKNTKVAEFKKYCHKIIGIGVGYTFQQQYWYWYRQYFYQSIVLNIDNSFPKYYWHMW